jgi:hypothetical protein
MAPQGAIFRLSAHTSVILGSPRISRGVSKDGLHIPTPIILRNDALLWSIDTKILSMPINRRKSHSSPVHFLAKGLGVSPRWLADEAVTAAGLPVGLNLPSNTFIWTSDAISRRSLAQSIEQVTLLCVGGKFANERTILGIGAQLFEPGV